GHSRVYIHWPCWSTELHENPFGRATWRRDSSLPRRDSSRRVSERAESFSSRGVSRLQRPDFGTFFGLLPQIPNGKTTSLPGKIQTAAKSVEMSLDAAEKSLCATSWAHAFSLTSGVLSLDAFRPLHRL